MNNPNLQNIPNSGEYAKPFWRSKTIWWAIFTGLAGVLAAFASNYPEIGWLATANSIVAIYLRAKTYQPISG